MYYKCCVPGCVSSRQDAFLHKFPKCEKRLQKWLDCINCDSLRNKSVKDLGDLQVCHKHFEARFVTQKSRLLGNAFPTLFQQSEILSGIPITPCPTETRNPVFEHQYAKKIHNDHSYWKQPTRDTQSRKDLLPTDVMPSTSKSIVDARDQPLNVEHYEHQHASLPADVMPSTSKSIVDARDQPLNLEHYEHQHDLLPADMMPSTSKSVVDARDQPLNLERYEHQHASLPADVMPSTSKSIVDARDQPLNVEHYEHQHASLPADSTRQKEKIKPVTRAVSKVEALTPKCRNLYNVYRKSRKLLSFTRRAKKALQFSKVHPFEEMASGMNPLAKTMLMMQLKLYKKKDKARRFTLDEKLIALSILKQGPKSYRFLQKIFILPSTTTLKKMVSKLNIDSGINIQIFESIKEEVNTWKKDKRYCTIVFDEMALETGLTYTHKDEICGFVDLQDKTNQFADHVLVFMIKGVVHKWQQPIAYYFCEGATSGVKLKQILKEIVTKVGETGLIPLALVSDQGSAFQSALKNLQEETRRSQILENKSTDDTIHIGGYTLSVIYDPCHLIKGLRNNFLTKNISFSRKIATWLDIVDVYQTDCQHTESRLLHKLNDEHVIPDKIKKMKVWGHSERPCLSNPSKRRDVEDLRQRIINAAEVKNCVRVFSKTVAGALNFTAAFSHYSDGRPVSKTLKNTAEVVSFFDDLFDSVNGTAVFNRKKKGKQLRSAVTNTSRHHAFWQEAIVRLREIKFVDQNGRETTVPSIRNWISTIQSMQRLWQFLSGNGIKVMRPRYLNSDAIENFFGQVRSYNFRDNNPTCHNFVSTFKSLLITGFIKFHHTTFNCENDNSNQILKIKSLFQNPKECETKGVSGDTCESCVETFSVSQDARRERLMIQSRAYTAGWVVRKILLKIKCSECKKNLTVEKSNEIHEWISHREYKKMSQTKLTYPAEPVVRYFGMIFNKTNEYLDKFAHRKDLSVKIKRTIRNENDFEHISCQTHRDQIVDALLGIVIKLCIHNWCNIINKILKGTDIVRLEQRSHLPEMQIKALNKYKKKLKKKNK